MKRFIDEFVKFSHPLEVFSVVVGIIALAWFVGALIFGPTEASNSIGFYLLGVQVGTYWIGNFKRRRKK